MAKIVPGRNDSFFKTYITDVDVKRRPVNGSTIIDGSKHYTQQVNNTRATGTGWSDWRQRIALGLDATTTLGGKRFSRHDTSFRQIVNGITPASNKFMRHVHGLSFYSFPSAPGAAADSVAEQLAATRLLASVTKAQQSWAGGSTIAEFAETVRFLGNPIKAVYGHTMSFVGRVGRLKRVWRQDPVRYGKLLGSAWLAYAFGLSPLVNDVNSAKSAVDALANDLGSIDKLPIIGTGVNTVQTGHSVITVPDSDYSSNYQVQFTEFVVRYKGALRARPPGVGAIAENFGVGFSDILPSIWEGIPWSWLVDYFVNVNEMLNSIRLANVDTAFLYRTVRNRRVVRQTDIFRNGSFDEVNFSYEGSGGHGWKQCVLVNRAPASVPYPSWRFGIPGMPRQYANVAALKLAISKSKP